MSNADMLGTALRHLLDNKLTTVKEIERITGRGSSTIYRWLNGEARPDYEDMRRLVRGLENREATKTMVGILTSDLPVVIDWLDDGEKAVDDPDEPHAHGHDVMHSALLALDCVTDALNAGYDAIRKRDLTHEGFAHLLDMMDGAIRHLTSSKNLLQRYAPPMIGSHSNGRADNSSP